MLRVPIEVKELKTGEGHPVIRVTFETPVTVIEAKDFLMKAVRGGQYFGYGHLLTGNIAGLSAEVRRTLTSEKSTTSNPPPIAIVVTSALTRMVAGLAMRMTDNTNTDFFRDDEAAFAWLGPRMVDFIAKGGADSM